MSMQGSAQDNVNSALQLEVQNAVLAEQLEFRSMQLQYAYMQVRTLSSVLNRIGAAIKVHQEAKGSHADQHDLNLYSVVKDYDI